MISPTETRNQNEPSRPQPTTALGSTNLNPEGVGLWELIREDLRTHDGDWWEPGFQILLLHRLGNWRMSLRFRPLRAVFTILHRIAHRWAMIRYGIKLDYVVRVGRRVRIWHHGGMILGANSIGDDVQLRQNTTFGLVRHGDPVENKPVIEDRVDIGCGACILGPVRIGHDSIIGANAVVISDIPPHSVAVGIPAHVVKRLQPHDVNEHEPASEDAVSVADDHRSTAFSHLSVA